MRSVTQSIVVYFLVTAGALAVLATCAILASCSGQAMPEPGDCADVSTMPAEDAGVVATTSSATPDVSDAGICGGDYPRTYTFAVPTIKTGCVAAVSGGRRWCCPIPGVTVGDAAPAVLAPALNPKELLACPGPLFTFRYDFPVPVHMRDCIETVSGGFGWCCQREEIPD